MSTSVKKPPYIRIYSTKNIEKFRNNLSNVNWQSSLNHDDANTVTEDFYAIIMRNDYECFPLIQQSRKRAKDKLWITTGLIKSINEKNKLFRMSIRKPSCENRTKYKKYRNILSTCIKEAEINYYKKLFENAKESAVNFWKSFRETLNPSKRKVHSRIDQLNFQGKSVSNDQDIANTINEHFCSVGDRISKKVDSTSTNKFKCYLRNKLQNSFYLSPVSETDVNKVIKQLKENKSPGPDGITNKLIKVCASSLTYPLTLIYNLSITNAQYPIRWKRAKVIALYKKKSKTNPENYRPISLLDCFGKIFEKLIYNQMIYFIKKYNILYNYQYGFREKHSTTHALVYVIDKIKELLDNQSYVIGLFLDIEKAFDCVNHEILLYKLEHYGFRGHSQKFLESYLTGRDQFTKTNNCNSMVRSINYGVPQGSILGPLLFLLYVNDIQNSIDDDIVLFADDAGIFINNKNFNTLLDKTKESASKLHEWYSANKMSVSFTKSNFVVFSNSKQKLNQNITTIKVGSNVISRVNHIKYIGVIIDERLTWEPHIKGHIIPSLSRYFSVFYNIRKFLDKKLIRTIYFSCILSKIRYGIEIYGNGGNSALQKLQILQNKLLRVLMSKDKFHSSNELHKDLKILKIYDMHKFALLSFVYNCYQLSPIQSFEDFFISHDHPHDTRFKHNLVKHGTKTKLGQTTTHFVGSTLWNDLPSSLKKPASIDAFKHALRDYYITNY